MDEYETKPCPGCGEEMSSVLTVCWDCFKYRTDITPFKYFDGSLKEWIDTFGSRHLH